MDNTTRLFHSVSGIIRRKPKDMEAIKFWVGQMRHAPDHEVSDKDAEKVIKLLRVEFDIK